MSGGLEAAIEELYRAFAAPAPKRIDACPCCRDPANYRPLHSKPLKALTSDELGSYAASAIYTVGSAGDFRYFMPRIFELAVLEPHDYPDIEIRLKKLQAANWRSWTAKEQLTVETFISEWFEHLLERTPPQGGLIDAFICGVVLAGFDLKPFLGRLETDPPALRAVHNFNAASLSKKRKASNAFWPPGAEATEYAEWLMSPGVQAKLGYA